MQEVYLTNHFLILLLCDVKVTQLCPTLYDAMDYTVHGILQVKWRVQPFPSPGDLPNPGTEPRSPAVHADSLPAEPPGKPKNTGVGSLSLLQRIFLIQDQKQVSHIAGGFYTSRATRRAVLLCIKMYLYNKYIKSKTINSTKANEQGSRGNRQTSIFLRTRASQIPCLRAVRGRRNLEILHKPTSGRSKQVSF